MLAFDVLARDPLDAEAIKTLEKANKEIKTSTPDPSLYPRYFDALAQVYGKKQSKYSEEAQQVAFRAINNLTKRLLSTCPQNIEDITPVVPILLSYLRVSGFHVNGREPDSTSNEARAAATLRELYLTAPSFIEPFLRHDGFGNSKPEVRHASLLFVEACLEAKEIKFKPLTAAVTHLLNDKDETVRKAATDLLVAFFGSAPPHAKADLAKEIKRQRVTDPSEVLVRVGLAPEPPLGPDATPTSSVQSSGPGSVGGARPASVASNSSPSAGAPLIHEIIVNPLYKMQKLAGEDVETVAEFRSIIESMKPLFQGKESDTNWEAREKAVKKLRTLIRGNIIDYPGDIVWALKYLAHDLKAALYSLRTTLCSQALHLVKDCTQVLKSYFDAVIDPYMHFICEVVSSTKKITSNLAYVTGCSLVLNTSMSTKIINYTHGFVSDQLPVARVAAFKWYHIMFVCHSPDIRFILESTKAVDVILGDLKKGLTDAQVAVREATRSVFWLFAACWPAKAEKLGSTLDSQAKKQLLRSQPKELLESYDHNFELHVSNKPKQAPPPAGSRPRPASRAASIKSQQRPSSRSQPAARTQSVPSVPEQKKLLTAQAHVPDIIRRISRALNDPKPNYDQVLEHHPAEINSKPVEVGGMVAPNEHVASALQTASKLIDEMPMEPTATPGQLETVESEPMKDVSVNYNGDERKPKDPKSASPKPETESKESKQPTEAAATKSTKPDTPKAAPKQDTKPSSSEGSQGDNSNIFQDGMLIESLVASAREAVSEALEEQGGDYKFDPSKFDQNLKITNASEFKDALRSELDGMPTIDVNIEAIASKTAKKMQPKFDEYVKMYPESKDAIMQAATLVESAARNKEKDDGGKESDGEDKKDGDGDEVMKSAVDEVTKEMDKDTEGTSSKLNSLGDLLDSDDVETMTMGVNVLSYVLRGKRPPSSAVSGLGTLSIPPPDLIGKALNYLFDQAMDHNPQVKELLEKFISADLVAITLSYVGHAIVMYVAVHLLPAEALVLTVQVIQPLLNIGAIIDTLFEIANADDVSEAALLALGGLLTGFDRIPMSPILRTKAKAALEVIYRLGDLSFDVTAFLADWIGFDSDTDDSSDSDDDTDDEKIAAKHARKFERHMAERAPSAVAEAVALIALEKTDPDITASIAKLRLEKVTEGQEEEEEAEADDESVDMKDAVDSEESTPNKSDDEGEANSKDENATDDLMNHEKDAIFAEPISSLHPVSISYMPGAQNNKAVRRFKIHNASALDTPGQQDDFENIQTVFSPVPKSQNECLQMFEHLAHQLEQQTIRKQGLIQLISLTRGSSENTDNALAYTLWRDLPQLHDRIARASLVYCQKPGLGENELNLGLILVRVLLENGGFNTQVDQLRVLECLCTISGFDLATSIEYSSLVKTRDTLLERNIKTDFFIKDLINVFETGKTSARLFALKTMRQVVVKTTDYPVELQDAIRAAITDNDVRVRKEAYPILLNIHMQSESAAKVIKEQLTQGQQRLFEYYSNSE